MRTLLIALCLAPTALFAACPEPDRSVRETELLQTLKQAPDEVAGEIAARDVWEHWLVAPDAAAQDLLDQGMARRNAYDFEQSEALLDQLVAYCPNYTEGWNQRAFTRFLRDDLDGALSDIDRVLRDQPSHFGALSGKALTLMKQGRMTLAQAALRRAVEAHPWLQERRMILPPTTPGQDI
ncbi:MAG: hypothetical protein AAFR93_09340 [Pseudomonadota bacterium]